MMTNMASAISEGTHGLYADSATLKSQLLFGGAKDGTVIKRWDWPTSPQGGESTESGLVKAVLTHMNADD